MNTHEHWSLDKRIPISLLAGLLIQSATIVWWARGVVSDIELVNVSIANGQPVQITTWTRTQGGA